MASAVQQFSSLVEKQAGGSVKFLSTVDAVNGDKGLVLLGASPALHEAHSHTTLPHHPHHPPPPPSLHLLLLLLSSSSSLQQRPTHTITLNAVSITGTRLIAYTSHNWHETLIM